VEVDSFDEIVLIRTGMQSQCEWAVFCLGSGDCDEGDDARGAGLGRHSYRITLLHHAFLTKSASFNS
jgi:hypothetical protein